MARPDPAFFASALLIETLVDAAVFLLGTNGLASTFLIIGLFGLVLDIAALARIEGAITVLPSLGIAEDMLRDLISALVLSINC